MAQDLKNIIEHPNIFEKTCLHY
ncbi:hypothetical protein QTO34_000464 [Cnephaeus nilssonii]|uniref:Uncharacterized protein n=2 Tax=Vespertilionidae TaxID=9431 RepID=A0AA40LUP4_CNENI|nr:hypothetical protein QTO34_000464 [Eptesicus nilssonii]